MLKMIRILIVEDEVIIALSLRKQLSISYDVLKITATGEDAIISAKENSPDIILMDINLSGRMNGLEAAEQIQAWKKIPIIFMTGYADENIKELAIKLNPLGYITKPIQMNILKKLIDSKEAGA